MKRSIFLIFCFILSSCIEEFIPETITFEDFLVVEATITDELKFQEIRLSRTFPFEGQSTSESLADISIIDDTQNIYLFNETEPGKYVSSIMFNIEPNKTYTLHIITKDNKSYTSSSVKLPSNTAQLTDVSYVKTTNSEGEEGIDIVVDSFDPLGDSKYYRYEFEETYKIIAPLWSPNDAIVLSNQPRFRVSTQPRIQEERVCYNTVKNISILQTESNALTEDRITQFPLKFISKESPVFRDKYSILVKQYVQSLEAHSYYETLNNFSNSENVFSENQPGFLDGNIISDTNANDKVIGFFEVTSLKSQRIYINYEDLYPNERRAPYFIDCDIFAPLLMLEDGSIGPLIGAIEANTLTFLDFNLEPTEARPGPFLMTQRECGDCTVYGSNIKPDYWID